MQTLSIVLIDDEEISNMINTAIIEMFDQSIHVRSYKNAVKALDEFKLAVEENLDKVPDIIFLDINMPIMDGWEFLEYFIKLPASVFKRCKIYILTSSIDPLDIQKSKSYSIVREFISKPLTIKHLEQISKEIKSVIL